LHPPWKKEDYTARGGYIIYINQITGDISRNHPGVELQRNKMKLEGVTTSSTPSSSSERSDDQKNVNESVETVTDLYFPPISPKLSDDPKTHSIITSLASSRGLIHLSGYDKKWVDIKARNTPYSDFFSSWNHVSPLGQLTVYSLTLRFYKDQSALMIIHNINNARYPLESIDGLYGPVSRLDLFIGSQVKLFGRNVIIKSAGRRVCEQIEAAGEYLMKKQLWIISKIEEVGVHPIIRPSADGTKRTVGQMNLRLILKQNWALCEQLTALGHAYLVAKVNGRFPDSQLESSIFWPKKSSSRLFPAVSVDTKMND